MFNSHQNSSKGKEKQRQTRVWQRFSKLYFYYTITVTTGKIIPLLHCYAFLNHHVLIFISGSQEMMESRHCQNHPYPSHCLHHSWRFFSPSYFTVLLNIWLFLRQSNYPLQFWCEISHSRSTFPIQIQASFCNISNKDNFFVLIAPLNSNIKNIRAFIIFHQHNQMHG